MGLGEVRVFRRDDDDAVPEVPLTVVVAQPVGHHVRLADVTAGVTDGRLVVAEQEIDAGALGFVAFEEVGEV